MTPTPTAHATFRDGPIFRYAGRRRQPPNPHDLSQQTPPNLQIPITPLPDNGVEEELSANYIDFRNHDDGADIEDEEEIEEEENDVDADEDDDEEGGIEEGALDSKFIFPRTPKHRSPLQLFLYNYGTLNVLCLLRVTCALCGPAVQEPIPGYHHHNPVMKGHNLSSPLLRYTPLKLQDE
jgi:hypothetical protein